VSNTTGLRLRARRLAGRSWFGKSGTGHPGSDDEARARAMLSEAQANRRDLVVVAPFDGAVISRTAEPGEVVTAGTPIVTLLDLHKVYPNPAYGDVVNPLIVDIDPANGI